MESISLSLIGAGLILGAVSLYRRRWVYPTSVLSDVKLICAVLMQVSVIPLALAIGGAVLRNNEPSQRAALVARCEARHDPLEEACLLTGAKPSPNITDHKRYRVEGKP